MSVVNEVYIRTMPGDRPVLASFTLEAWEDIASLKSRPEALRNAHARNYGRAAAKALMELLPSAGTEEITEAIDSLAIFFNTYRGVTSQTQFFRSGVEDFLTTSVEEQPNE